MGALTFYPESHVYELDGVRVPSVTGILKASGLIDFSKIPSAVLEAARLRGTLVHAAIHYYNDRDFDVDEFSRDWPTYAPYLQAWISFCEQRKFTPVLNEHRVASRRYQVAGTLDCLGILDGVAVLLDFATGRPEDCSKDLQTSAYLAFAMEWVSDDQALAEFFLEHPYVKRYAVALRKDATFRLEPYSDPGDFRKFATLVEARRIVEARKGEWTEVAA